MDEILAEFVEGFLYFHNSTYGSSISKAEMFTYDFEDLIGITKDQIEERLLEFYTTKYFEELRPVTGAKAGVKSLLEDHDLSVITARPYLIRLETEQWLNQYFPGCFKSIDLTNEFQYRDQGNKRKIS